MVQQQKSVLGMLWIAYTLGRINVPVWNKKILTVNFSSTI